MAGATSVIPSSCLEVITSVAGTEARRVRLCGGGSLNLQPRVFMTIPSFAVRASLFGMSAMLLARPMATAEEPAQTPASYQVSGTLKIGGEGRWDYIAIDPAAKLVYVPRSTHTQIIRENTGEVAADLPDTAGVHGVALAPDLNRGFTSNGKANSVTIFDLKTFAILGTSKAGENPDAILYDPASKKVFAFNGKSKDVTVIDAAAAPGPRPWRPSRSEGSRSFRRRTKPAVST